MNTEQCSHCKQVKSASDMNNAHVVGTSPRETVRACDDCYELDKYDWRALQVIIAHESEAHDEH